MDVQGLLEQLADAGYTGSVKVCFDRGRVNQVVESSAGTGTGACLDVDTAGDLLAAASLVSFSGYVMIYYTGEGLRATFVRVRTPEDSGSTHFEAAFQRGGATWTAYMQKRQAAAL